MSSLYDLRIVDGPFVVVVVVLTGLALVAAIVFRPSRRWRRWAWYLTVLLCIAGGLGAGFLATWFFGDVLNIFEVHLTRVTRIWVGVGFSGIAIAIAGFVKAKVGHIVVSALAMLLSIACSAMVINVDFGQFPTVGTALGQSAYVGAAPIPTFIPEPDAARPTIATWKAPATIPKEGTITEADIPGTVSAFPSRKAIIYLPPAAFVDNPPLLPVIVALSGQPGTPGDPLAAGGMKKALDAYAVAHQGLAPIVVSPDQLGGNPAQNPMCIDGPFGKSATYLTVDVVNWVKANLPALTDTAQYWAIAGYSQGATCATQLAPAHPDLYRGLIDASGELVPSLGSVDRTIRLGFGGNAAAYAAAAPIAVIQAHAPLTGKIGVFGAGANDKFFKSGVNKILDAAKAAGMATTYVETPNAAHDATAWAGTLTAGVGIFADAWGLNR